MPMRLFGTVNGAIDRLDRAGLVTPPFDRPFQSTAPPPPPDPGPEPEPTASTGYFFLIDPDTDRRARGKVGD